MNQGHYYPLTKIPFEIDQILYLICEELKSRRLSHALQKAGIDDCYFLPHLDSLILRNIGLDEDIDKVFSVYNNILERRSKKIEADHDSIVKQAFKVYQELINEKRKGENRC